MIDLLISKNKKRDNYNEILVIFDKLTIIVYHNLIKIIINIAKLVKIIKIIVIK